MKPILMAIAVLFAIDVAWMSLHLLLLKIEQRMKERSKAAQFDKALLKLAEHNIQIRTALELQPGEDTVAAIQQLKTRDQAIAVRIRAWRTDALAGYEEGNQLLCEIEAAMIAREFRGRVVAPSDARTH